MNTIEEVDVLAYEGQAFATVADINIGPNPIQLLPEHFVDCL
jgi:hypothetical protein